MIRVFVVGLLALSLVVPLRAADASSACGGPLLSTDFSTLHSWSVSDNAALQRHGTKPPTLKILTGWPFGSGVSRDITRLLRLNRLLVVRAEVRGADLVRGDEPYKTAKVVIRFEAQRDRTIRTETRLLGTFGWRYAYAVAKIPRDVHAAYVMLRNEAAKGVFQVRQLQVYSCAPQEVAKLDYPRSWDTAVSSGPATQILLQPSASTWRPLNHALLGYNGPFWQKHMGPGALLNNPDVTALAPGVLRFPGGILANFYHWKKDGFDLSDLLSFPAFNRPFYRHGFEAKNGSSGTMGAEAVARWAHRRQVPLSLVLNVASAHRHEDLPGFVSKMQKAGAKVGYLELGNELYWRNQGGKRIRDGEDYVHVIKPVIAALKRRFPAIPIGVDVSATHPDWDRAVVGSGLDFNACILHPYVNTASVATVGGDLALIRYADSGLAKLLGKMAVECGNRPLWITEWNFQDRPLTRLTTTKVGVLFSANALMTFLTEPEVRMAAYYSLFAKNFGLFDVRDANVSGAMRPVQPIYGFFKSIGTVFKVTTATRSLVAVKSTDPSRAPLQGVRVQEFSGANGLYLMIINNQLGSLAWRPGKAFKPADGCRWYQLSLARHGLGASTGSGLPSGSVKAEMDLPPVSVTTVGPFVPEKLHAS